MATTKAAFARAGARIDGIAIREVPVPGAGEAMVRLRAATLNFRDLLGAGGLLPGTKEPEYVPVSDAIRLLESGKFFGKIAINLM